MKASTEDWINVENKRVLSYKLVPGEGKLDIALDETPVQLTGIKEQSAPDPRTYGTDLHRGYALHNVWPQLYI